MRGGLPMPDITTPRAFPFLVLGTALLVSLGGMGRAPLHLSMRGV